MHYVFAQDALCLDELSSFVHHSKQTMESFSLSRRIMRLVPIFILQTHNEQLVCLPKFVQTDNVSSR